MISSFCRFPNRIKVGHGRGTSHVDRNILCCKSIMSKRPVKSLLQSLSLVLTILSKLKVLSWTASNYACSVQVTPITLPLTNHPVLGASRTPRCYLENILAYLRLLPWNWVKLRSSEMTVRTGTGLWCRRNKRTGAIWLNKHNQSLFTLTLTLHNTWLSTLLLGSTWVARGFSEVEFTDT